MGVGRYFGREPHVSQQEAEAQAKQAIEAAVSKGRPPEQEWKGLAARTADISRELATRPPVDIPPPPPRRAGPDPASGQAPLPRRPMNQILRPQAPPPEEPAPTKRAPRPAKPPAAGGTKRPAAGAAKPPAAGAAKPPAPGAAKRPTTKKRPG